MEIPPQYLEPFKKHSVLIKKSFHSPILQMLLWSKSLRQQLHHVKKCRIYSGLIVSFEVEFISWPHETRREYSNLTFMPVLRCLKGSHFIYSFFFFSLLEWQSLHELPEHSSSSCLVSPDSTVQEDKITATSAAQLLLEQQLHHWIVKYDQLNFAFY